MYVARPWLFLGIGLLAIPISLVIAFLQAVLLSATSIVGIDPDAEGGVSASRSRWGSARC